MINAMTCPEPTPPTLLDHADVWLGPGRVASRLLMHGGRVLAIDPPEGELPPGCLRRDLGGALVTPGLHDAHLHLFWRGEQLARYADLSEAGSWDDVILLLQTQARRLDRTAWVLGRGLNDERLRERAMPPRDLLDRGLPGRAVVVTRVCGHAGVFSGEALARLPNHLASAGREGAGLLVETPFWEALGHLPPLSDDELDAAASAALAEAAARGFTAVGTMLEELRQLASLERLAQRGELPVRVVAHLPGLGLTSSADGPAAGVRPGGWRSSCGKLQVGAAKFFSDGTLGARTARLRDDYSDAPGERGRWLLGPGELAVHFERAAQRGYRIAVHAIGDAALAACLDALEPLTRRFGPRDDRIEHVSLADDPLIDRLARWGGTAVVQPQFATSDTFLERRLGPGRVRWAYRFRSMVDRGVPVALSSDCPVERLDPDACLASAMSGSPWNHEGLSEDKAIEAYTLGSARAGGLDAGYGRLVASSPADLTVFDRPPSRGGKVTGAFRDGLWSPVTPT